MVLLGGGVDTLKHLDLISLLATLQEKKPVEKIQTTLVATFDRTSHSSTLALRLLVRHRRARKREIGQTELMEEMGVVEVASSRGLHKTAIVRALGLQLTHTRDQSYEPFTCFTAPLTFCHTVSF